MRMRGNKMIPGLAVIVWALAVTAAPAMAYESHEFIASSRGPIKAVGLGRQVLKLNGMSIECMNARSTGEITAQAATVINDNVTFSKCTARPQISQVAGTPATITKARLGLGADGTLAINSTITISIPGYKCTVIIPPWQTFTSRENTGLSKVVYQNEVIGGRQEVKMTSKVKGITSTSTCGIEAMEEGTYGGELLEERVRGDLEWR